MSNFEKLTPLLESFIKNGPAGCACRITLSGKTEYEKYFGYADEDTKKPITADTIYRIYSMSKIVTATAALMLYERGLFLLNDPLYEYLPEFKDSLVYRHSSSGSLYTSPAACPIRVKDIFTMSSGLTYDGQDTQTGRQIKKAAAALREKKGGFTARDFSKAVGAVPLAFDPGTHWLYALSYEVIGALIEVVSGKTFGDFLRDEIFEPLGMKDTSFRLPVEKNHRLCTLYDINLDGTKTSSIDKIEEAYILPNATFESGGAGLLSTLGDYSRYLQMLACGGTLDGVRILGANTIKLMASNHLNPQQLSEFAKGYLAGFGYGLGVRVLINPPKGGCNSNLGEFGWSGALGTWALVDPSIDLSVTFMQQTQPHLQEFQQPRMRSVIYGAL